LIKTGTDDQPGIDGGMIKRRGKTDGQAVIAYVCTVKVASVDAAVARATTNGGVNVVPKMAIPPASGILRTARTRRETYSA